MNRLRNSDVINSLHISCIVRLWFSQNDPQIVRMFSKYTGIFAVIAFLAISSAVPMDLKSREAVRFVPITSLAKS
jgi:hypothetical protein